MTFRFIRPSCHQRGMGCYFVRGESRCRNCGRARIHADVVDQSDIRDAQDDVDIRDHMSDTEADLRAHQAER